MKKFLKSSSSSSKHRQTRFFIICGVIVFVLLWIFIIAFSQREEDFEECHMCKPPSFATDSEEEDHDSVFSLPPVSEKEESEFVCTKILNEDHIVGDYPLVFVFNKFNFRMALNALRSLERINEQNYLFFPFDLESYKEFEKYTDRVYCDGVIPTITNSDASVWNTKEYMQTYKYKYLFMNFLEKYNLIERGIIYSDVDMVFFDKNFRTEMIKDLNGGKSIAIMHDYGNINKISEINKKALKCEKDECRFNPGMFIIRKNDEKGFLLLDMINTILHRDNYLDDFWDDDQNVIRYFFPRLTTGLLKYGFLDIRKFKCGKQIEDQYYFGDTSVFHLNYVRDGEKGKIKLAKDLGIYYL